MIAMRLNATICVTLLVFANCAAALGDDPLLADVAEKADWANVRDLLHKGVDVNATQVDGMTALHWAAYHDDLPTVELLVKGTANVKSANRYGVTPLSLA